MPAIQPYNLSFGEKPRYRIQWEYNDHGNVIGYFVMTMNVAAIALEPSKYYPA